VSPLRYFFDLGNTRAKFWCCRGEVVIAELALPHGGNPAGVLARLPEGFRPVPSAVCGISVLGDDVDAAFSLACNARWGLARAFARSSARFGALRSAYEAAPERLGVDRWLGLIAAARECDVLCVVSCGTAVTIDVADGMLHRGGYIVPGPGLMEASLQSGTRKVRYHAAGAPATALGRDTAEAVRNGIQACLAALIERVVREHGVSRLVLTGGDAAIMAACLDVPAELEPELLLKGMLRYFENMSDPHGMGESPDRGE